MGALRPAPAFGAAACVALVIAHAAHAEVPLDARARDPAGWWKGRVLVEVDARADGGLVGLARRAPGLRAAGADGLVLAPMTLDAGGAVEDHAALDPRAGAAADWTTLVEAAHRAELAIVVAFEANDVARTHAWFTAAESGDRLAQDAFVWVDQRPTARAERWSESARGGRWYYHTRGPERPDLDLRHRLTRARVRQAAEAWIERGADGLLLGSVRALMEDETGALDRPESVGFVRELAGALAARGALAAVDVDDGGFVYLDPAGLALDGARAQALTGPRLDEAVVERGDRSVPLGSALGLRASDRHTAARALAVGESVVVAESLLSELRPLLEARRGHVALRTGLRTTLEARGNLWSFVRHDGTQRSLVAIHGGEAAADVVLDLRAFGLPGEVQLVPLAGAPAAVVRGGRASASLPASSVSVWQLEVAPGPLVIGFGRPGMVVPRGLVIDRGLAYSESRGIGASRDVERSLRCARGKDGAATRCGLPLEGDGREPLRWHLTVAPGPYEVEVDVEGGARVLAEGQPLTPAGRKRHLAGAVFVRDGRFTLEASDPSSLLLEVRLRPARFKAAPPQADVRPDRVVLRSAGPGVVEWRMNGSRAEPAESAPLVRRGTAWEATLGPWPKGAVTEVAWVIKSAEGTFVTAEGGGEVKVAIE